MRKVALWLMIPLFWIMCFLTIFSTYVEEWMKPQVVDFSFTTETIPSDVLFWKDGEPHLYQSYYGIAWDDELHIREIPQSQYTINPSSVTVPGLTSVVRYSSKPLTGGEKVTVIETQEIRHDIYLLLSDNGFSALKPELSPKTTMLCETDAVLLLQASDAEFPFLPDKTLSSLLADDSTTEQAISIFSFCEVEQFFSQLKFFAVLIGIVLVLFVFWLSCTITARHRNHRVWFVVCLLIHLAAIPIMILILRSVSLPSSLLPAEKITDVSHYASEFSALSAALDQLGEIPACIDLRESIEYNLAASLLILATFVVISVISSIGIRRYLQKRNAQG